VFADSFKKGRRVLTRDQTINIVKKLLELAVKISVDIPYVETDVFQVEEFMELAKQQNIFQKVFVPSIGIGNQAYNSFITGMVFVDIDPLMEGKINYLIENHRSIYRVLNERDSKVEEMINNALNKNEEVVLKTGDMVEILSGDYSGIIGKIETIEDDQYHVAIQIFGATNIIVLSSNQVKIHDI